jgi:hypothetical protein
MAPPWPGGTMNEGGHGGMAERGATNPAVPAPGTEMTPEKRAEVLREHHRRTQWAYWLLVLLGVWLVASPWTFGHGTGVVEPGGGRQPWLPLEARVAAMTWSDVASGLLLIVLGFRSIVPDRPFSLWGACFVGIWLSFAPILFWAPTALGYLNNTIVGVLVIALAVVIPGMPNMAVHTKAGPEMPPGWSYNPSSWPQRAIMIALLAVGWLVSRYLAAFQLGYIEHAFDPFFGDGTRLVLTSDLSRALPVSDGGLGALVYTFEFITIWMGGASRWRTSPWTVTVFGILVIPLGLVHIILVVSQPLTVGHWCTLCLLVAAITLLVIPLEADEVVAMGQLLARKRREGEPFRRVFWTGGTVEGGGRDERSPEIAAFPGEPGTVFRASIWGMSFPPSLVASSLLGIWLMASPDLLLDAGPAAAVVQIGGALLLTVSVVAMGEVTRAGRFLNIPIGLLVAAAPFFLTGATTAGSVSAFLGGLLAIALSIPRGRIAESYGSWNRLIF